MIQQIVKDNEAVTPITREMEGLKEYFPQCFNNKGEFDMEKFREAIQPQVDVTREGRSYDFLGKSYARMLSSLDTTTVIRPDVEHNSKPENLHSENIYISGDNLDALHHLVKSYAGQVKCIYIDPPYNTGTDGFTYNDKFKFTAEELVKKLSITPDEAEKIIAMTSGHRASHAAWLTFMMPRLQLARDLLSKDGVIFISIDDNEQAYLKQLCDNIYGEDN
jgi:adenine specific DNA methylase Mod